MMSEVNSVGQSSNLDRQKIFELWTHNLWAIFELGLKMMTEINSGCRFTYSYFDTLQTKQANKSYFLTSPWSPLLVWKQDDNRSELSMTKYICLTTFSIFISHKMMNFEFYPTSSWCPFEFWVKFIYKMDSTFSKTPVLLVSEFRTTERHGLLNWFFSPSLLSLISYIWFFIIVNGKNECVVIAYSIFYTYTPLST